MLQLLNFVLLIFLWEISDAIKTCISSFVCVCVCMRACVCARAHVFVIIYGAHTYMLPLQLFYHFLCSCKK